MAWADGRDFTTPDQLPNNAWQVGGLTSWGCRDRHIDLCLYNPIHITLCRSHIDHCGL